MTPQFYDLEDRLVVSTGNEAAVWSVAEAKWKTTSAQFARKAWIEGEVLTRGKAARRFPSADIDAAPTFPRAE